jgi:Outer membrane receptor for ferrienterochelin and colicins
MDKNKLILINMRNKQITKSVFVLICLLFFCGNGFAQINLSVKKQTIKQILPQIEKASGYSIFYSNEMPDLRNIKSDFKVSNASLTDALNQLFKGTDISYQIKEDKQILLVLKSQKGKNADQPSSLAIKKIRGKVVDSSNEPLIGATVRVKDGNNTVITSTDGSFSMDVPEHATLSIGYVGYNTKQISVGDKNVIDVVLEENTKALDEIVVIGYGAVKKKDLTGAVASVKGADLAVRKTAQLSTALQGAVSGLMVTRNNNAPGASASSIRVRGITTIGDSDPLVIVDGVPGDINQVNANDVESISVLKDAASAAIYGSRAAAGVILVTTKRAGSTDLSLSYTGEFGIEKPTAQPEVVGVQRYLEMTNELRYNDNPTGGLYQTYSEDQVNNWISNNAIDPNNYPITDWQKLILKNSAPRQTHTLDISGGSAAVRTKASLSYDNIDGLYADRNYKRYMMRVNNDFTINKKLGATLDFNMKHSEYHQPVYDPFTAMRMTPAIYAAVWDDGRIAEGKSGGNPYGLMLLGGNTDKSYNQINGKASLDYKPFDGFKLSAVVAPIMNYNKTKTFKKQASYTLADDPTVVGGYLEDNANPYSTTSLSEGRTDSYSITSQFLANYNKTLGVHDFSLMAGYENYYEFTENLSASRDQYTLSFPYLDNGPETLRDNGGNASEYAYRSFFGRMMYSYDKKYLLQANIRNDGSSRFASRYRWGTFPSFSTGWVMSEENFMKDLNADWLSYLKLRASWGALGNERIGDFPYLATIEFGNALFYQDGAVVSEMTAAQKKYAVENISWEKTESTDIGLDVAFFKNRLRVTGDYY